MSFIRTLSSPLFNVLAAVLVVGGMAMMLMGHFVSGVLLVLLAFWVGYFFSNDRQRRLGHRRAKREEAELRGYQLDEYRRRAQGER